MRKLMLFVLAFCLLAVPALASQGVGEAMGFGGKITVNVTVEDGILTDVSIDGPDETAGIGANAVDKLPAAMLEAGTVDVDGVSGATVSSTAILAAAKAAYSEAIGETAEQAEVKLAPGTYTNQVWAFSVNKKMDVSVTLSDTGIESIEVGDNGETEPILDNAKKLLIPRIIENQSYAVDAVTGATGSSSGIKQGVMLALRQALEAAGTDAAAISAFAAIPEKISGVTKELNYDVVVVGMGGAGSAAAMSAAEAQAAGGKEVSVLAIDKAGKYGGTSSVTSEMMAINPPRFMKDHDNKVADIQLGVFERPLEDTRSDKSVYVVKDEMKNAWLEYTEGDCKEDMLDLMLDHSGETLDWLMYDHGFYFGKPQLGVDLSAIYFCVYQYNGSFMDNKHIIIKYFDRLYQDFTELGGEYMLETEGYDLINEDGKITGILARSADGTEYVIHAKSVILATGGFCGNGDMTTELIKNPYYPLDGTYDMVGMTQNDGKMIQAALDDNAGTYNINMTPIVHIGGSRALLHSFDTVSVDVNGESKTLALNDVPMVMALNGGALSVDRNGKRFTDETGLGFLEPWKGGPSFYSIWTQSQVDEVKENGFDSVTVGAFINQGGVPAGYPIDRVYEVIDAAIGAGTMYKFDALDDMAAELGMDAQTLRSTVEKYNAGCSAGVDEDFGKDAKFLRDIGEGPYYVAVGAPYAYSTTGGLDVDASLRVLDADGEPIPGLYAAGTDCLGVLLSNKKAYVVYGGCAQGWAFTSGKLAGTSAATAFE